MDLSAIWNAMTDNLATVSLFSVGGLLWAVIKWVHHRVNKRHRFKMLLGETVDIARAVSFYQQSQMKNQDLDRRAFYAVETRDTLVVMLLGLQDRLRPLKVYLFSEYEMTTAWLQARDKATTDGRIVDELGRERVRETGTVLLLTSGLMRAGDYRKAKKEFPRTYDVARKRISGQIKSQRENRFIDFLQTLGIED